MAYKQTYFLIVLLLLQSCLKANEDSGVAVNASPFSNVTSNQVQEAYILNVNEWNLTEDGKSIFRQVFGDMYFGLEVISSSQNPIQGMTVQLAKDIQNFANFLAIDGIFEQAQSLKLKLPLSMFNIDSLFLSTDSIDYGSYTYLFRPKDGTSDQTLPAEITAEGVYVDLDQFGTVIVKKLCADGTPDINGCTNIDINLSGPVLDFLHYHNKRASLRTFSWDALPSGSTAECSVNGGSTWITCDTATSHTLTVAQFNAKPVFKVRSTDGVVIDSIDLAQKYVGVKFHTCSTASANVGSSDFAALNTIITNASDGQVICFADNAQIVNPDTNVLSINISKSNLVLIGDHINRPLLNNLNTAVAGSDDGSVLIGVAEKSGLIAANLKLETPNTSNLTQPVSLTTFNSSGSTTFTFSNVKVTSVNGHAIYAKYNNNIKVYDCEIITTVTTDLSAAVYIQEPFLEMERTRVTVVDTLSIGGSAIFFDYATIVGLSRIVDSVLTSVDTALYISADPDLDISIADTVLVSKEHGIYVGADTTLEIHDSLFVSDTAAQTGSVFFIGGAGGSSPTIDGAGIKYCKTVPAGGFDNFLSVTEATFEIDNPGDLEIGTDLGGNCPNY